MKQISQVVLRRQTQGVFKAQNVKGVGDGGQNPPPSARCACNISVYYAAISRYYLINVPGAGTHTTSLQIHSKEKMFNHPDKFYDATLGGPHLENHLVGCLEDWPWLDWIRVKVC